MRGLGRPDETRVSPREIGSVHRTGVLFRLQIVFLGLHGPEDARPFYGMEWQIGESLDSRAAAAALSRGREPSLFYTSRSDRSPLSPQVVALMLSNRKWPFDRAMLWGRGSTCVMDLCKTTWAAPSALRILAFQAIRWLTQPNEATQHLRRDLDWMLSATARKKTLTETLRHRGRKWLMANRRCRHVRRSLRLQR